MTDYKQLCAELLAALESWSPNGGAPLEEGAEAIAEARLIERARAALSQPELRIIRTDRDEAGPYMLLAEPEPEAAGEGPTDGKLEEMFGAALLKLPGDSLNRAAVAAMRAAIAADRAQRQPVPLSERPWEREGWCDEQGRCWALNEHLPAWEFHDCADSRKWADLFLPAHALPLPVEVES